MLKHGKKALALLLAATMLGSTLAGCGGGGKTEAKSEEDLAKIEPTPTTGEVNEFGWEMPKETIKIDWYHALQSSTSDNEKYNQQMHDYLLENFNVDLNKIVYDTDPAERMNLMRASNDYADVITYLTGTQVEEWKQLGAAIPLEDLMKTHAPNLYARFEGYLPRFRDDDGKLWKFATGWSNLVPERSNMIADTAPMVRQDWYEEIGSPDISTPDAYFEAVKKMVENHPTTPSGGKTYGLSMYDTKAAANIVPSFVSWWGGMFGLKMGWDVDDTTNDVKLWINSEKGEKLIKYMNRFYREGLLDPDGLTMPVEQWGEKGVEERYAAYIGPWFQPTFYISDYWKKQKGDSYDANMRYVHYNVKDPDVEHSTFNPKSTLGGGYVIITDKCENPADVMRWWEFENSELGTKLIGWGIPGLEDSVWDLVDGKAVTRPEQIEAIQAETAVFDFEKFMLIGGENQLQMTISEELQPDGTCNWFNQSYKDKWKAIKDENLKDSIYDFTAFRSILMDPEDPLTAVKQRCGDIINTAFAKAISAPTEEECMQIIEDAKAEAIGAGLSDVEKFYSDNYKANVEKYKG